MRIFDIAPRKLKANSGALVMHIGKRLSCILRNMWSISYSIEMEWTI